MRYFPFILLAIFIPIESQARCNHLSANYILNEVVGCLAKLKTSLQHSVDNIPGMRGAYYEIHDVCTKHRCNLVRLNSKPACDREFAKIFLNYSQNIDNYARNLKSGRQSLGCYLDEEELRRLAGLPLVPRFSTQPVPPSVSNTPPMASDDEVAAATNRGKNLSSCFWLNNSIVYPKSRSCGRTPMCVGAGYCEEGEYEGDVRLMCDAIETDDGYRCPSLAICAIADDPAWATTKRSESHLSMPEESWFRPARGSRR